jgi:N6-adenosine-specific RNA methylase IME4
MMSALTYHPFANLFPLIDGVEFEEFVADVRQCGGVREPIVLYEGKILDGRNRYRGSLQAGTPCPMRVYDGDDPLSFVISLNLKRRHLDESQRAMVAAKLATLAHGQRQTGKFAALPTQAEASALLNVAERSVRSAAVVRDHGAPELQHAVDRGEVAVSTAADLTALPIEQQQKVVARGEQEVLRAAKEIRARKSVERHAESVRRIAELSQATRALPTGQRFSLILADPPWYFEVYNSESGSARAAELHYPCMRTEDICAMPVCDLACDDAVLFLWTTGPHLEEALRVVNAWGFRYATNICWVKDQIGLGYYVRNQHELLLVAMRGNLPAPLPAQRPPSVVSAPRREHSRKPDEAYEMIERMYPDLPKIELFARGAGRLRWSAWGNEAADMGSVG